MLSHGNYKTSLMCAWITHDTAKAQWRFLVWNKLNIPKHAFIAWLIMWGRLKTKDRLHRFDLCTDTICEICGVANENIRHLFFGCHYGNSCLTAILPWLQIRVQDSNLHSLWKKFLRGREGNSFQRKVAGACIVTLAYHIWKVRTKLSGTTRWPQFSKQLLEFNKTFEEGYTNAFRRRRTTEIEPGCFSCKWAVLMFCFESDL